MAFNGDFNFLEESDNGCVGVFHIYINSDQTVVYKKPKNTKYGLRLKELLGNEVEFNKYSDIILNTHNDTILGRYTIKGFDIEDDGAYKCKYIHGYRLDRLQECKIIIEDALLRNKISERIFELNRILIENSDYMIGDWVLHNLVYSIDEDTIYNIDLEGFYTYQTLPQWGTIDKISKYLDNVLDVLQLSLDKQRKIQFIYENIAKMNNRIKEYNDI
jgi:hypothetical protein